MHHDSITATAEAGSNIAFIKYWGARDLGRAIPLNVSISMTLSRCRSVCKATFVPGDEGLDRVCLGDAHGNFEPAPPTFASRVLKHLQGLRAWAELSGVPGSANPGSGRFLISTHNTFPMGAGIASSASGFAALTLACVSAMQLDANEDELSLLARASGSGSATRSVLGGYVEWPVDPKGGSAEDSEFRGPARQILAARDWPLCDLVALVQTEEKKVSSLDGHQLASSSPYFEKRLALLPRRLDLVRGAIRDRDFSRLGPVVEEESIDLHLIAMSSRPAVFYWLPATLAVLERVRELRGSGVAAYCTMDAGANVHVLCEPSNEEPVYAALAEVPGVVRVLRDHTGEGPVVHRGPGLAGTEAAT